MTKLDPEYLQEICDETGFSPNQVYRFYYRFTALDRGEKGYLTCQDLLSIPEMKVNPLGERIVFTMYKEQGDYVHEIIKGKRPMTEEIRITFKAFCRAFAHFQYIDPVTKNYYFSSIRYPLPKSHFSLRMSNSKAKVVLSFAIPRENLDSFSAFLTLTRMVKFPVPKYLRF